MQVYEMNIGAVPCQCMELLRCRQLAGRLRIRDITEAAEHARGAIPLRTPDEHVRINPRPKVRSRVVAVRQMTALDDQRLNAVGVQSVQQPPQLDLRSQVGRCQLLRLFSKRSSKRGRWLVDSGEAISDERDDIVLSCGAQ